MWWENSNAVEFLYCLKYPTLQGRVDVKKSLKLLQQTMTFRQFSDANINCCVVARKTQFISSSYKNFMIKRNAREHHVIVGQQKACYVKWKTSRRLIDCFLRLTHAHYVRAEPSLKVTTSSAGRLQWLNVLQSESRNAINVCRKHYYTIELF